MESGVRPPPVGLLYETGNVSAYETITFHRIPTSELTTS